MAEYRYNPPPNWPAPPEGWQPPQGWQPDPAWGPAPDGWQFWVPANGSVANGSVAVEQGGRPNRNAWGRTAVVALISVAILAIFPIVGGADDIPRVVGFFVGRAVLAYVITALWAFLSRKRWGWGRYVLTFVLITLLLAAINSVGAQ